MDMDLTSYVKVYSGWIEKDKCNKTIEDIQTFSWDQHTFYNSTEDASIKISGDNELDVSHDYCPENDYLMQRTWLGIQKYVSELNFFWLPGWCGHTQIRFNKYKESRMMALHCDHITSMFDGERKGVPFLTVLGVLNDDYEGGDFVMWDKEIKLKMGDLLIFPSSFLYPHKVNPITKGERYTFVSWVW